MNKEVDAETGAKAKASPAKPASKKKTAGSEPPEPRQTYGAGYLYHCSAKYQNFHRQFLDVGGTSDIYEVLGVQYNPDPELLTVFADELGKPMTLHSFEYCLGNVDRPAQKTIDRIQTLAKNCNASYIGEHMAFMGMRDYYCGGFMQPPGTEEQTQVMIDNLTEACKNSVCPIIIENPSQFVNQYGPLSVGEQLKALSLGADVGILLSLSNISISEEYHPQDRDEFLSNIPMERVRQIHLLCGNSSELDMPGMEKTKQENLWALDMLEELAKDPKCRPASVIFELEAGLPSLAEPERLRDHMEMARDLFFKNDNTVEATGG